MLHQLKNQSDFQCQPQAVGGLGISIGATKWLMMGNSSFRSSEKSVLT